MESSQTRDRTCVPCVGRWIPNHWTTREVPILSIFSLPCSFIHLLLQQTFIQRARHHPGCGETEVSLFIAWWKTTRDVNRWFPASLEHGEGPHPGGPPSTRDSSLSDTQSACCNDGKTQKFLGTEQLRSGKKEKNKTKNMPERLLGGIINVLLRRKILVCVSRHANTSANKATQRKQVEPWGFSHKGLKNKREKKQTVATDTPPLVAERTFPTR